MASRRDAAETSIIRAASTAEWRDWLARNGRTEKEVWLIIYAKNSGTPSVRYHEAIEHALCYGWIDSQARKVEPESSQLRFTPRNPRSTWSQVNRERAGRMIEQGMMTEAGQAMIDLATASGTWQVLADPHSQEVPADLRAALDANADAAGNFAKFPPSSKRLILEWVATAKKPETRQRRISRTVELAAVNIRANHPGVPARDPEPS